MAPPTIMIRYDQMERLAQAFAKQQTIVRAMAQRLTAQKDILKAGAWQSPGANDFYREVENTLLPGLGRLAAAMGRTDETLHQIIRLFKQAEEAGAEGLKIPEDGVTPQVSSFMQAGSGNTTPTTTPERTWNDYWASWGEWLTGTTPAVPPPPEVGPVTQGPQETVPVYSPHGAESPTAEDQALKEKMRTIAATARDPNVRLIGYGAPMAAQFLDHYLGNTGETLQMSQSQVAYVIDSMPVINRMQMQERATEALTQQISQHIGRDYQGQPMEFQIRTAPDSSSGNQTSGRDTNNAIGGFTYSQTATVRVTPGANGGPPTVTMYSQEHIYDRYDFLRTNNALTVPSFGIGVIDNNTIAGDVITNPQMHRLHTTGIAQEFDVRGSSATQRTSYVYPGPLPGATPPAQ